MPAQAVRAETPADASGTLRASLRPALVLFVLLTVLTGILYPLVVTLLAQAMFPQQAAGSLIERHGVAVGSRLIGQSFSDPEALLGPAVGDHSPALQRHGLHRLEPGALESRT